MTDGWSLLLREAAAPRAEPFRIPPYSELMPAPWVGPRPYEHGEVFSHDEPSGEHDWPITEYEAGWEIRPGLRNVAKHIIAELNRLRRGETGHQLPKTLLRDNAAWPENLAAHARAERRSVTIVLPLALSKTQNDKGDVRWTLFGTSHEGPARAFWRSFDGPSGGAAFRRFLEWAIGPGDVAAMTAVRILPIGSDPDFACWADEGLPEFARALLLGDTDGCRGVRTVITFRPFARIPASIQQSYFAGAVRLVPSPETLVFHGHAGYRRLARELPLAMQNSLLQLFPRSETSYGIRIPQSGWLDEIPDELQRGPRPSHDHHGRRLVRHYKRSHRWQRHERDAENHVLETILDDDISKVLFSARPEHLGLYGKPMARNAEVWTEGYGLLLDGARASPEAIAAAGRALAGGGRFGYRMFFPPMRVGPRSLFWHVPLVARFEPAEGAELLHDEGLAGHLTAERDGAPPVELRPRFLHRAPHAAAAELFLDDPGRRRLTTARSVRKLLEWPERLGRPLPPSFARRLIRARKHEEFERWLGELEGRAADRKRGAELVAHLRAGLGPEPWLGAPLTLELTRRREFEERYWRAIASLCEGSYRDKNNGDPVRVNEGRTGGERGREVQRRAAQARQLDELGDHIHRWYADAIARAGMEGVAYSADHELGWRSDFDLSWLGGFAADQDGRGRERNIACVIPGRNRGEAVIMADHYDTAYMEDLYAGDGLRAAAAGADDNHSATAALMLAADVLLPLARERRLERDVWLVHLTGEEFPSDCLGARALAERLVERSLTLRRRSGDVVDVSRTRVRGVYVLDMVAHNNDRDRDIFQIAPGEGAGSAQLAWHAYLANRLWNESIGAWNHSPERHGRGRGARVKSAGEMPVVAAHPRLQGEVRPSWDPRSALFNTDGQIFSDAGIPVVLFMENYDINRQGYHDTHDTMENIDLDYGAALCAIAIETVAIAAAAATP